jgi:hypothetical protein
MQVTVAGWGVDQAENLRASLALRLRLDSVIGLKSIPTIALLLAPGPGAGRARAAVALSALETRLRERSPSAPARARFGAVTLI